MSDVTKVSSRIWLAKMGTRSVGRIAFLCGCNERDLSLLGGLWFKDKLITSGKQMKYLIVFVLACVAVGHHDDHDVHDSKIEIKELAKSTKSWNGELLPAYPKGQPEVTILKITVPPKTKLALHRHPYINAGVLLKGELTVVTEDHRKLKIKAGDSIVELVNQLHFGENTTDQPAEIIVFYAGVEGRPVTIKQESVKVKEK